MMHIVLLILKIIGILLLSLLGIALFLILTVLFVPVRYKVRGEWHGQARAGVRVHWLFHMLSFRVDYDQKEGLCMKVRALGIPIWRSRKEKPTREVKAEAVDLGDHVKDTLNRELDQDERRYRESAEKKWRLGKKESEGKASEGGSLTEPPKESATDADGRDTGGTLEDQGPGASEKEEEKDGFVAEFFRKIVSFFRKTMEKLRFSLQRFYGKLKGAGEFVRNKREWLEDEKNQKSLRFLWKQTRRFIAHLWPIKGRGSITFGFEDPYTTGQALQVASLIYPFYHRQLSIHPVFDRQMLEGEGSFQGRIRLGFLLWLMIQIYFDRHTWKLIRSFL